MVEVVFEDSAAGSLRQALVGRHKVAEAGIVLYVREEGEDPLSPEEEARLRAAERRRQQEEAQRQRQGWAESLPLPGQLGDILVFPLAHSVGEITEEGTCFSFVPFAGREYIHCEVEVDRRTTGAGLAELIQGKIEEKGVKNIYKFLLKGYRDPDILFDLDALDRRGNITDITDETKPAWDMEKLYRNNKNNLIGRYIESFSDAEKDSVEYRALFEGVSALMETRRGTE